MSAPSRDRLLSSDARESRQLCAAPGPLWYSGCGSIRVGTGCVSPPPRPTAAVAAPRAPFGTANIARVAPTPPRRHPSPPVPARSAARLVDGAPVLPAPSAGRTSSPPAACGARAQISALRGGSTGSRGPPTPACPGPVASGLPSHWRVSESPEVPSSQPSFAAPSEGPPDGVVAEGQAEVKSEVKSEGKLEQTQGRILALQAEVRKLEQKAAAAAAAAGSGSSRTSQGSQPSADAALSDTRTAPADPCHSQGDVLPMLVMLEQQLSRARDKVECAVQPEELFRVLSRSTEMESLTATARSLQAGFERLAERQVEAEAQHQSAVRRFEERLEEAGRCLQELTAGLQGEARERREDIARPHSALTQGLQEAQHAVEQRRVDEVLKTLESRLDALPVQDQCGGTGGLDSGALSGSLLPADGAAQSAADALLAPRGEAEGPSTSTAEASPPSTSALHELVQEALSTTAGLAAGLSAEREERLHASSLLARQTQAFEDRISSALSASSEALEQLDSRFRSTTEAMRREFVAATSESSLRGRSPFREPKGKEREYANREEVANVTQALASGLRELDRRLQQESQQRQDGEAALADRLHRLCISLEDADTDNSHPGATTSPGVS